MDLRAGGSRRATVMLPCDDGGLAPGASRRHHLSAAGNTLVRMNYGAIAVPLEARGIGVITEDLRWAEHRARVRLDANYSRGRVMKGYRARAV
jgi:hypothetical protein